MIASTKQILSIAVIAVLALGVGFVVARGQLFPFPAPGTHVPGLTVSEYDAQGFILAALGITIMAGIYLIPRMARGLDASLLFKLLVVAFVARMLGSMVRLWTGLEISGFADVARYDRSAEVIGSQIRHMEFGVLVPYLEFGTEFTKLYTGIVYSVIGPSIFGGYLVFGLFSFLGSYFFYKAFRVAFPEGRHRFYGLLVFFWPSLLYWTNGIGKDSLMILFLGIAAYGSAILLVRGKLHGLIPLAFGLAATLTVRPQITVILIISLVAAFMLGKAGVGKNSLMIRGLIVMVGIGIILFITPILLEREGLSDLSLQAVEQFYDARQETTGDLIEGAAAFKAPAFSDPLFVPKAFATVLFRPYPWEAHRLSAVIQGFDGVLLAAILFWRAPSLGRAILRSRSNIYVIFIVAFVVMLVLGLATIANFGTLARERAMILPLLLMLVAFAPLPGNKESSRTVRTR